MSSDCEPARKTSLDSLFPWMARAHFGMAVSDKVIFIDRCRVLPALEETPVGKIPQQRHVVPLVPRLTG